MNKLVKGKVEILLANNVKYHPNNTNRVGKYVNRHFLQFLKGFDKETEEYIKQYNTYILCDENPIVEGDFVIYDNKPHQVFKQKSGILVIKTNYAEFYVTDFANMKVIATDNEELNLPSINYKFLEEYCRLDGLCDVNIYYEQYDVSMGGALYQPKTTSFENEVEVFVSTHKDFYSKNEVINLINTAFTLGMNTEHKSSYMINPDLKQLINRL